jgi:putative endonuclease
VAFFTHMLASKRNGTLYLGYTDDLYRRVFEHREGVLGGFTSKYAVTRLVWFEAFGTREEAWRREKAMKKWRRAWKLALIERHNPGWADLADQISSATL